MLFPNVIELVFEKSIGKRKFSFKKPLQESNILTSHCVELPWVEKFELLHQNSCIIFTCRCKIDLNFVLHWVLKMRIWVRESHCFFSGLRNPCSHQPINKHVPLLWFLEDVISCVQVADISIHQEAQEVALLWCIGLFEREEICCVVYPMHNMHKVLSAFWY